MQRMERYIAVWEISAVTSNDPNDVAHASAEKVVSEIKKELAFWVSKIARNKKCIFVSFITISIADHVFRPA
jgi:hypothetical protein